MQIYSSSVSCGLLGPVLHAQADWDIDLVAYCAGRTLLPKSNGYLCDIAPMAQKDECVKHALLAMAASYVLDYSPSDSLRARANTHYKKAANLLSEALKDSKSYTVGQEESVLAALVLFSHDDVCPLTAPCLYGTCQASLVLMPDS